MKTMQYLIDHWSEISLGLSGWILFGYKHWASIHGLSGLKAWWITGDINKWQDFLTVKK